MLWIFIAPTRSLSRGSIWVPCSAGVSSSVQGYCSVMSAAVRLEWPWVYSLLRTQMQLVALEEFRCASARELDGESDRSLQIDKLPAVFKTAEDQAQ